MAGEALPTVRPRQRRLACKCLGISETCYGYQTRLSNENAEIAD